MENNKEVDYRILLDLLENAELKAKENLFAIESSVSLSLADVIREKKDTIEFLLAYFKKQGGSGYKQLSDLMSESGIKVSDGVLTTTIARVRKTRGKKSKVAAEVSSLATVAVVEPMTVTRKVVTSKPVAPVAGAVVAPGAVESVPGEDYVFDWPYEKERLGMDFKANFVGSEWNTDDVRFMNYLAAASRKHGMEVSKIGSAQILPDAASYAAGLLIMKARKLGKLTK
jgi:hypothetical protein